MDHNEIRHALSEYLDGSLGPAELAAVKEHLKTCTSCSDALAELRKTIEQVKSLEQVDPPAWMQQKIMARVREEHEKRPSASRHWFFPFRFPIETVGVVLLAVAAFFIYRSTDFLEHNTRRPPVGTEATTRALKEAPARDDGTAITRKLPPQNPGYKALDMKQEYEAPAPPVPENAPSPVAGASAAVSAPEQKEGAAGTKTDESAGILKQETLQRKARTLQASGKQESNPSFLMMKIIAHGKENTFKRIEKAVKECGGTVLNREPSAEALTMIVKLDQAKQVALLDRLRAVGIVAERTAIIEQEQGLEIVVTENKAQ
jgi:hypothetical protein